MNNSEKTTCPASYLLGRCDNCRMAKKAILLHIVFIIVSSCAVYPTLFVILSLQNSEFEAKVRSG